MRLFASMSIYDACASMKCYIYRIRACYSKRIVCQVEKGMYKS